MAAQQDRQSPLLGIQLLRGLTACLVVLAHVNLIMGHPEEYGTVLLPVKLAGMFAVSVFFAISGFIIAATSLTPEWQGSLSPRAYFTKRFIRILPFMWICVVGYNLLSAAAMRHMEGLPFLRAMTLWPVGELKPNVIWSLQHEVLFYLLFALSFLGKQRRPWLLALWFAAPLAAAVYLATGGAPPAGAWADLFSVFLLGGYSGANAQFATGFIVGLAYVRWKGRTGFKAEHPFTPSIGAIPITMILLLATAFVEWTDFPVAGFGRIILWSLLAGGIVWSGAGMVTPVKQGPVLRAAIWLGDASFSIYLVHSATLMVLLFIARRFTGLAYALPLLALLTIFLISVASGVIAHLLVERPLIAWLAGGRSITIWQQRSDASA